MYRIVYILFFFIPAISFAQASDSLEIEPEPEPDLLEELKQPAENGGYVTLKGDPGMIALVNLHIKASKEQKTVTGYRIQIFSGNSYDYPISQLEKMKEDFQALYPDVPVYLNYFDPEFKIRAGNFRSRLECIPVLKKIRKKYPSSYPVKTEIPFHDLLPKPAPLIPEMVDDSENIMEE